MSSKEKTICLVIPKLKCEEKEREIRREQLKLWGNEKRHSQSYGFSSGHVWMWELDYKESWVLKNWCFSSAVLEKTLESPLDCKEIKLVILKEINPEYSLEELMLNLKLQHFGHLMQRADSLEKTLMLGKIEDRRWRDGRGRDGWLASPTQWTWVWANTSRWWRTGMPGVLQSMGMQRVRPDRGTEQQQSS